MQIQRGAADACAERRDAGAKRAAVDGGRRRDDIRVLQLPAPASTVLTAATPVAAAAVAAPTASVASALPTTATVTRAASTATPVARTTPSSTSPAAATAAAVAAAALAATTDATTAPITTTGPVPTARCRHRARLLLHRSLRQPRPQLAGRRILRRALSRRVQSDSRISIRRGYIRRADQRRHHR